MLETENRVNRAPRQIFPWSISITGRFGQEGLKMLELDHVLEVVEFLDKKPHMIIDSVMEIVGHGELRRAVHIARTLVWINPRHKQLFMPHMDEHTQDHWFKEPLDRIPTSLSRPPTPVIKYIQ
jgi:hypothetical protein